jgi:peptidoglycan/LPS O-acetylase OafA/YrhL
MNAKIDALTSLRFFAAFAVVIHHMGDYSLGSLRDGPLQKASLAVDLFFILSGFILAHVYGAAFAQKKGSSRKFFVARMARIYPAHLAMMIVFLLNIIILILIGFPYNAERYRPESFLWHVTLLDAWGIDRGATWNFPAWSISAEVSAYLLFPLIVRPLMQLPPQIATYSLLLLLGAFALLNGPLRLTERTVDFSIIRVLPEFLMGVLAYRARDHLVACVGNANVAFSSATAILVVFVWLKVPAAAIVVDFVALVVFGATVTGLLAVFLAWRPLIYLGETSYSLYLVHAFILSILYNAFKIPRIATFVPVSIRDWLVIVAVLLAASLLYHVVEKPGRRIINRALADPGPSLKQQGALP